MAYPYQPTYQPQYPTYNNPMMSNQPTMQNQQTSTDIIWVQGEAGAKAYPVAPGKSVQLMDSENSVFYIKTTDVSGMPQPLRIFSYEEIQEGMRPETIDTSNFITRDEFEQVIHDLKEAVKPPKPTNNNGSYSRKGGNTNAKPLI